MTQSRSITTRQSILDAAVTEFWEHGYRGASVRDICARAGASSNAITYHFGSKEKLYQEILDQFGALLLEQAQTALSGELRSQEEFKIRLEMFLLQILETCLSNRKTVLIVAREFEQLLPENDESAVSELVGINYSLSNFVQKAKDQGFVREDVDVSIVAGTLMDRLLNQARFSHTHERFFNVTSLDPEYRTYWVRASLGLVLDGMKPRAELAQQAAIGEDYARRTND
jgi:AcrR family transcriptional regulator